MEHIKENGSVIRVGGVSFSGVLTVGFIILKLMKVINWSWWWVLSPLWISAGLGIITCIIFT